MFMIMKTRGPKKRTLAETGRNAGTGNGIAWTWIGADYEGKPILCDTEQDDFYITWPEGVDASALTVFGCHRNAVQPIR